jgi:transcriptional regulator with XRE-family HTH domain
VPARERAADRASAKAAQQRREVENGIRTARLGHDLGLADAAAAAGISPSEFSRVERGLVPGVPIDTLARMAATVGQELSVRLFPAGPPVRDAAHIALLEDLRARTSPSLRWATEVPLPIPGDPRAWDALIRASRIRIGVEAETRLRDVQAVTRRVALKQRDSEVERMILLVRDSRWNRQVVRLAGDSLAALFPVPGSAALDALRAGRDPGGNALILL